MTPTVSSQMEKNGRMKFKEYQIISECKLIGLLQQECLNESFQGELGKMHVHPFSVSASNINNPPEWNS